MGGRTVIIQTHEVQLHLLSRYWTALDIRTHKHAKDEYHILASNADAGYDLWQLWHDNRLKLPRWYAKDIALIQPFSAFMERAFSIRRACMDERQESSLSNRVAASALLKYNRGRGK